MSAGACGGSEHAVWDQPAAMALQPVPQEQGVSAVRAQVGQVAGLQAGELLRRKRVVA